MQSRPLTKAEVEEFRLGLLQLPTDEQEKLLIQIGFLPQPGIRTSDYPRPSDKEAWQRWFHDYAERMRDPSLADGLDKE